MVAYENLEETLIATNILFLRCLVPWATDTRGHAKNTFDHISSLIQFLDETFRHVLLVLSLKNLNFRFEYRGYGLYIKNDGF